MSVVFETSVHIDAPVAEVFALSLSTELHVGSMSRYGERMVAGGTGQFNLGDVVTWRARPFGVHWTMTSRITELDEPHSFTDQQIRGPFAGFRHDHRFEPVGDGTLMIDRVAFRAPFGLLGWLVERLLLARYMKRLIMERNDFLKQTVERSG
jgi:ligand-binding SRPBCC domain-containing protein